MDVISYSRLQFIGLTLFDDHGCPINHPLILVTVRLTLFLNGFLSFSLEEKDEAFMSGPMSAGPGRNCCSIPIFNIQKYIIDRSVGFQFLQ